MTERRIVDSRSSSSITRFFGFTVLLPLGRRPAVLLGFTPGKRWRASLSCLLPETAVFLVTALLDTAMESPPEIVAWLREQGAAAEVVDGTEAGLRRLADHDGVRVITGSFYLVGRAREQLDVLGIATLPEA